MEVANKLPDDKRLEFYDALIKYALMGIEPENVMFKAMFEMAKPLMEEPVSSWGGKREGAGRHKNQDNQKNQDIQVFQVNQDIQDNQVFQVEQKETKKNTPLNPQKENNKNIYNPITPSGVIAPKGTDTQKRFVKPTVEEINTYCRENNKSVDAERFWNFYESKGWKVGKSPMKDWRAAVRNWCKDSKPSENSEFQQQREREERQKMLDEHWED